MMSVRRLERRGIVLIVTLWVLTILAIGALTFAATMHVEARAAANEMQRTRALYAAKAGVQRAMVGISQDVTGFASDRHSDWAYFDSEEEEFPFPDDERYEVIVTDECAKIDLNAAEEELLEQLPQMAPEMIDCILDWRDADGDARPDGAEMDYYSGLRPPRACANRPFLTLSEVLLVKGVTKEAFYGSQALEPAAIMALDTETSQDELRPLLDVVTLYGGDNDLDAQGQERLNINLVGADQLAERTEGILTEGDLQAILDYRGATGAFESIGDLLKIEGISRDKMQKLADVVTTRSRPTETEESGEGEQQPEQPTPGQPPIPGAPGMPGSAPGQPTPPAPTPGRERPRQLPDVSELPPWPEGVELPPLPRGFFPSPTGEPGDQTPQPGATGGTVADIDTASLPTADEYRAGIYNINTAPAEVLSAVEGMTEQVVQAIIRDREQEPFTARGDLLNLSEVTDDLFAQVVENVTVRSSALKITAIGSVEDGRVRVRLTVIVDLKDGEPKIVHIVEG